MAECNYGRPLSRSTINQYLSAVQLRHHMAGHAFDRKHPVIAEMWRSISGKKAKKHGYATSAAAVDSTAGTSRRRWSRATSARPRSRPRTD
jgi:hypothetical protein